MALLGIEMIDFVAILPGGLSNLFCADAIVFLFAETNLTQAF